MNFKELTIEDKDLIESFTINSQRENCDLSFANLYSWRFLYQTTFTVEDDFLIFRFYLGEQLAYMMPLGKKHDLSIYKKMIDDAEKMGSKLCMIGVNSELKDELEELMPGVFDFTQDRDYFDYIYLRDDLATLKGKKLQSKRNHINKFKAEYPNYVYRELSPELVPQCLKLEEEWCHTANCNEQTALAAERRSMTVALNNMEKLDITGGVLYVEDKVVAFTYGGVINKETWDVCVEKADTNVDGSYAMINYEYANHIDSSYKYINREEDLGIDGLRKAKLSYKPFMLLEKWIVTLK